MTHQLIAAAVAAYLARGGAIHHGRTLYATGYRPATVSRGRA